MNYWYPLIKDLPIPQPRTEIVLHKKYDEWWSLLDGVPLPVTDIEILKSTGDKIGYPLFLRTDLCSGKHSYASTCYVENKESLGGHVVRLVDDNCSKDQAFTSMVFREFIELDWQFKAFNKLPIAPERRYFIRDGKITGHFPYWPENAIMHPDKKDWKSLLKEMNIESDHEIEILSQHAKQVSMALPGYWSIDFAKGRDGIWYLIDMAEAIKSWRPNP